MITKTAKLNEIKRNWHFIDLKDQTLGRVTSKIAQLLIGKGKVNFSPTMDSGDYVVAFNSDKISVTGKKMTDKLYQRHSGHPGGFRELTLGELMAKDSRKVIIAAVKGMLPKNKLQDPRLARLKVFTGTEHPYQQKIKK